MAIRYVVFDRFDTLRQVCPTFLLVRATFTGEKLLRATFTEKKLLQATCIFTEIKLQKIESFLCKTGAHFSQYSGNLSPKVGEEQKKSSTPQIGADFGQYFGNLTPNVDEDQIIKKKVFAANPQWFRHSMQIRLFICHKIVSLSMRKPTSQKDLAGHGLGSPALQLVAAETKISDQLQKTAKSI